MMEVTIGRPQALVATVAKSGINATLSGINVVQASGEIEITENGQYDVKAYARANVNVPIPPNYGRITRVGSILTVS